MLAQAPEIEEHRLDYRRPFLYPKQFAAIFEAKRYSLIEASTKAGKTSGCIVWIIEQALGGRDGWNYWWVAPVSGQADIAFRRTLRALPRDMATPNITLKTITLLNGAIIWFKSGDKPDSLYGEDVYAAVVDEASRTKEESWHALRSTLTATRGPVRIIGNVKGRRNWFYAMARKAQMGDPAMAYHKIIAADAVDAHLLAAEEIEDARRLLPDRVFRELYLAEPSDDEGNPFGLTAILSNVTPLSTAPPAVWGWDLAKHVDWTVGIALDEVNRVCRLERFQLPWDATMNRIIDVFPPYQQTQVRIQLSFVLEGVMSQSLIPKANGQGRALALEVMVPNPAIRNLIREDKVHQIYSQMQVGQDKFGMQTMNQCLMSLLAKRIISVDDALGRSSEPDELKQMLSPGNATLGQPRRPTR